MSFFEHQDFDNHESVHGFCDPDAGLFGFIAVHSTHRGPAAGGCRLWHYETSADALTDALRLSRGMSYKNAIAGLSLGGGKAVIMKPADGFDRKKLFAALGKSIQSLGGMYYTAEDVGVSPSDMDVVHGQTSFVAGLETGDAASGDPSPVTADGVFRSIRCAVHKKLGRSLSGVTVAVQGLGHVGYSLCELLCADGANLIVTDINKAVLKSASADMGAKVVGLDEIYAADAEVFAPCALGAILNEGTIKQLKCSVIAGAANNQLSVPAMAAELQSRDIVYCPDYVVNGGGIINIAGEIEGTYSREWVEGKLQELESTVGKIIDVASETGRTTADVADEMAEIRMGRRQAI